VLSLAFRRIARTDMAGAVLSRSVAKFTEKVENIVKFEL
jgi:hypothetical protein